MQQRRLQQRISKVQQTLKQNEDRDLTDEVRISDLPPRGMSSNTASTDLTAAKERAAVVHLATPRSKRAVIGKDISCQLTAR